MWEEMTRIHGLKRGCGCYIVKINCVIIHYFVCMCVCSILRFLGIFLDIIIRSSSEKYTHYAIENCEGGGRETGSFFCSATLQATAVFFCGVLFFSEFAMSTHSLSNTIGVRRGSQMGRGWGHPPLPRLMKTALKCSIIILILDLLDAFLVSGHLVISLALRLIAVARRCRCLHARR